MTIETIGIGLLCLSQAAMWIREWTNQQAAELRHAELFGLFRGLHARADDHSRHLSDSTDSLEMKIGALGQRKTRSDAGKPRKGSRNGAAPMPSEDPIGKVST